MTAVKPRDVDRALASPGPDIAVLLVYGPDVGLVSERARAAASAQVPDPGDPFQLIRLDGDDVAGEPGRLVDEVSSLGLFAGPRVVVVRPTTRNLTPSVAACLDLPGPATLAIIEAGNLAKSSPLRALCESSRRALALPCFPDETRDVADLVTETVRAAGLKLDPDARDLLVESVGADRLATRNELAKLLLFAHGQDRITADHVEAIVSDVSAQSTDAVLDSAFAGAMSELDAELRASVARAAGSHALLSGALRHALALLAVRVSLDRGDTLDGAMQAWRGLHFKRRKSVERQASLWRSRELRDVVARLQEATLETRRNPGMADQVAASALVDIGLLVSSSSVAR